MSETCNRKWLVGGYDDGFRSLDGNVDEANA